MCAKKRLLLDGHYYHIICRGNQKQSIFKEEHDFRKYLGLMRKYRREHKMQIYAFCLMPNHVHIVSRPQKAIKMSRFMQCLTRAYTAYFNNRYQVVGQLWQGRFKSKIITKDQYLLDCLSYVELNPVRAKIVAGPQEYRWSSYKERILGATQDERLVSDLVL